jgi:hypothetical protein
LILINHAANGCRPERKILRQHPVEYGRTRRTISLAKSNRSRRGASASIARG